jgi:hypothetical protein
VNELLAERAVGRHEEPLPLTHEERVLPARGRVRGHTARSLAHGRRHQRQPRGPHGAHPLRDLRHEPVALVVATEEAVPVAAHEEEMPLTRLLLEHHKLRRGPRERDVEVRTALVPRHIDRVGASARGLPPVQARLQRPEAHPGPNRLEVPGDDLPLHASPPFWSPKAWVRRGQPVSG